MTIPERKSSPWLKKIFNFENLLYRSRLKHFDILRKRKALPQLKTTRFPSKYPDMILTSIIVIYQISWLRPILAIIFANILTILTKFYFSLISWLRPDNPDKWTPWKNCRRAHSRACAKENGASRYRGRSAVVNFAHFFFFFYSISTSHGLFWARYQRGGKFEPPRYWDRQSD